MQIILEQIMPVEESNETAIPFIQIQLASQNQFIRFLEKSVSRCIGIKPDATKVQLHDH